MKRIWIWSWITLALGLGAAQVTADTAPPGKAAAAGKVLELDWEELIPEGERERSSNAPPAPMHDYLSGESGPAAGQSPSFGVNKELDGLTVKIPGFIVPLDLDADSKVVEFFLVPYFGACIHVPPPPPNQIVHVTLEKGIALDSMYEAYWITGKMTLQAKTSRLGAAAYSLHGQTVEVYKY